MKKFIASVLTLLIFVFIYSRVNWNSFLEICVHANLLYLAIAASFFIITTFVSILRWKLLLKEEVDLPLITATKIFLAAMSLNSVMPSKLGDLTKAYFLRQESIVGYKRGFDTVFLEKLLDLSSLCLLFLLGATGLRGFDKKIVLVLMLLSTCVVVFTVLFITLEKKSNPLRYLLGKILKPFPRLDMLVKDTEAYLGRLKNNPRRLIFIIVISVALWAFHLVQIYFFFLTLGTDVKLIDVFGLVPAAILIGLLPLTIGGMGTRDAALIYLFSDKFGYETMAAVGILVSTRYWVPSLVGLPFLRSYTAKAGRAPGTAANQPVK